MKEVFQKCKEYYLEHIDVVKGMKDEHEVYEYLRVKSLNFGLCIVLLDVMGIKGDALSSYFRVMKPFLIEGNTGYWYYITPFDVYEDGAECTIIECLEKRIELIDKVLGVL